MDDEVAHFISPFICFLLVAAALLLAILWICVFCVSMYYPELNSYSIELCHLDKVHWIVKSNIDSEEKNFFSQRKYQYILYIYNLYTVTYKNWHFPRWQNINKHTEIACLAMLIFDLMMKKCVIRKLANICTHTHRQAHTDIYIYIY